LFAILFVTIGQRVTPPTITAVMPGSAAEAAGLKPGDTIASIDGQSIARFEQIVNIVQLRPGVTLSFGIKRDGKDVTVPVTPALREQTDVFGNVHRVGQIGVSHEGGSEMVKHGPVSAWSRRARRRST